MINYEEELKKFHPSMDVNEAEDAIYSRDLTDVTDILKEMLKEDATLPAFRQSMYKTRVAPAALSGTHILSE